MSDRKIYTVPEYKEPDHEVKKRKGTLWCPYEGKWQKFKSNNGGYNRCEGCNISTEDFYVKTSNGLWESIERKKKK